MVVYNRYMYEVYTHERYYIKALCVMNDELYMWKIVEVCVCVCVTFASIWFKVSPSFCRYSYQNCSCKRNTKDDFHPWTFTFLPPTALGNSAAVRRSDRSAAPLEHLRSLRWASPVKPLTPRLLRVSFLDMLLIFPHLSGNGTNDLRYAVDIFSNRNWHNWHSRNGELKQFKTCLAACTAESFCQT